MNRGKYPLIVLGTLLVLLLSACGADGGATTPAPTPTPKAPKDLLQSSNTAMDKLNSEHGSQTITMGGQALAAFSPALAASSTDTSKLSATLKIDGDESKNPDQSSKDLTENVTVGVTQVNVNMKQVTKDNKVYVQNAKGQWFVLDKNQANSDSSNPFGSSDTSSTSGNDKLYQAAEQGKIVNHGQETLNGKKLHHLTVTLDQNGIQEALSSTNGSSGADFSKFQTGTIDFWIDDATSYTYRIDAKFSVNAASIDPSSMIEVLQDTSNFNTSFTVTVPANATPATSYQQISQ